MLTIAELLAQKIWNYHFINDELTQADCIIGLGSYDVRVAERCADLYSDGFAPMILFSGGLGNWTKNIWTQPEAEIFKNHVVHNKNIPPEIIKIEPNSTNIGENIKFTKALLANLNFSPKKIILVTKPNTTRRAYATFKKIWDNVELIVTSPILDFNTQPGEYITKENLINEMVGDLQRIKLYSDLGYQIEQEIPNDVWLAYEKLVELKYDKHLVVE